jgi:ATP-binding cassette, subfamily B, bacterial
VDTPPGWRAHLSSSGDVEQHREAGANGRFWFRRLVKLRDRRWLKLPLLLCDAGRIVWRAGRRELAVTVGLQLLIGAGVAGQLLLIRAILAGALASSARVTLGQAVPEFCALLAVSITITAATAIQIELGRVLGELVTRHTYGRVLDVAAGVDLATFESADFFDHLKRAESNGQYRPLQMVNGFVGIVGASITIAGISAVLLALQPLLLPLMFASCIPLWYANTHNGATYYEFAREMTQSDRLRQYLATLLHLREPAKEVRAFELADFLRTRYERLYDERISRLRAVVRERLLRSLWATGVASLFMLAALALIVVISDNNHLGLASATTALVAMVQLRSCLHGANTATGSLYESGLLIKDYTSFLAMPPELPGPAESRSAPGSFGCLAAQRVCFTYPGSEVPALTDVSLEIRAGEVVALVGENGSGKTTLAKLLAQLYRPDSGCICWDGVDTAAFDAITLRRSIAVLFQDFVRYLFAARENIGIGRPEHIDDEQRIRTAARRMGAHDLITALPAGYDTVLGKEFNGGHDLSLGQWQRLALARAFFRDAPFVVLDEPVAALDPRAEHELFRYVREMLRGRAVLMITHRFSNARMADRIYVLDGGRILEQGTHDELAAAEGRYAELYAMQASSYLAVPGASEHPAASCPSVGAADSANRSDELSPKHPHSKRESPLLASRGRV